MRVALRAISPKRRLLSAVEGSQGFRGADSRRRPLIERSKDLTFDRGHVGVGRQDLSENEEPSLRDGLRLRPVDLFAQEDFCPLAALEDFVAEAPVGERGLGGGPGVARPLAERPQVLSSPGEDDVETVYA